MKTLMLIMAVLLVFQLLIPCTAFADSSADFLFDDSEEFYAPDIDDGPWIYHSEDLSVCIKKAWEYEQLCYVADIYIRNNEKAYTGWANMEPFSGVQLPHIIAREYHAVFGLMGDYIGHSENRKGIMIRDGIVYYDEDNADVLAVLPSGEMEVYMKGTITAEELQSQGVTDSLAFGPILVLNGDMTESVTAHRLKPKNVRTGIGKIENGHYIAIVSRGMLTFKEYAQVFINYGCEWAYNLDGGHSAAMVIMGEQVNGHSYQNLYGDVYVRQRPVSEILLLGTSGLVPGVDEEAKYPGSR